MIENSINIGHYAICALAGIPILRYLAFAAGVAWYLYW